MSHQAIRRGLPTIPYKGILISAVNHTIFRNFQGHSTDSCKHAKAAEESVYDDKVCQMILAGFIARIAGLEKRQRS